MIKRYEHDFNVRHSKFFFGGSALKWLEQGLRTIPQPSSNLGTYVLASFGRCGTVGYLFNFINYICSFKCKRIYTNKYI